MTSPVAWTGIFDGYQVYVFPHEHGHFSVVFIRPTADVELTLLRHRRRVRRRLPGHPRPGRLDRPGARHAHQWRARRRPAAQRLPPPTRPTRAWWRWETPWPPRRQPPGAAWPWPACRSTGCCSLLDGGADPTTVAEPFGAWCDTWIRPWVEDHLAIDAEAVRSWQGADIDLAQPLTSTAIVAAAQAEPRIAPAHRWLPGDDGAPRLAGAGRAAGPGRVRVGMASAVQRRTDRDELVDLLEAAVTTPRRRPA